MREIGKFAIGYRGERASLWRGMAFPLLGRRSPLLLASFGRGELLVDAADMEISRVVFMTGGYERHYMAAALDLLTSATGAEVADKTFLDIGANIGTSTIDALLHFGFARAVCFEPDPRNLRLLKVNLVLNDLEDRVEVHPIALSDRDGEGLLQRSSWNFGDSRVASPTLDGHEREGQAIPCWSLDSLVKTGAVTTERVGLVWMDVQGHEPFVLSGAAKLLEAGVPTVIEYSPSALQDSGGLELLEALVRRNYTNIIDVRMHAAGLTESATCAAANVHTLRTRYDEHDHTDLLLLRAR